MIKRALYLSLFAVLFSCGKDTYSDHTSPKTLYPDPIVVPLNTGEGYWVNAVTGDSVPQVKASNGQPLNTGILLPLTGREIDMEKASLPQIREAGEPKRVQAYKGYKKASGVLRNIPINRDSVLVIPVGTATGGGAEMNAPGAPVIKTTSREIEWRSAVPFRTKSIPASLPRRKDDALKNVTVLDTEQGLEAPIVRSIAQDNDGNMWIGTDGNGILIYNGINFRIFSGEEGLASKSVTSILVGNTGSIWIATENGLNMVDGDTVFQITSEEGLVSNFITSLHEDFNDNLWITYFQQDEITKLESQTCTNYDIDLRQEVFGYDIDEFPVYRSDFSIYDSESDHEGNIWFASWGQGAIKYDGKTFAFYNESSGMYPNYLNSVTLDDDGCLWFGSTDGVSVYRGDTITYLTKRDGLIHDYVYCSLFDSNGDMWIGTSGGGVCRYDGARFEYFTEEEGLSIDYINSLFEDVSGNIWVGTNGGGVSIISGQQLTHFTENEGLSHPVVFSLYEDRNDDLWFGTRGGGVNRYDGDDFYHYTTEITNLGNDYVLSIMEDREGALWFGTYGNGASRYDGMSYAIYNNYQGMSDYTINCMLQDRMLNYWFGTYRGGVTRFNSNGITHYEWQTSGIGNHIFWLMEDRGGRLWVASYPGVKMIKDDSIIHLTEREGLLDNTVRCIMEDRQGNMWFGTASGISVLTGDRFIQFTEKEGLCSSAVTTILEGSEGDIWIGTSNGLNRMIFGGANGIYNRHDSTYAFPLVLTYGKEDGLNGMNFYHSSVLDNKNRLWYGSGKNLTMLDLNNFAVSADPPTLKLDRIDIEGQIHDFHNGRDGFLQQLEYDRVASHHNYPLGLKIPFRFNHLTFHFSAIDWNAPHKLLYSYRIRDVDKSWSVPSKEAKADYRSLPFGMHTFEVAAIGESQEWSEPVLYAFTVLPPWYHTWLARAIYLLAGIALVMAIVRFRTASLKKRQKELEIRVAEATQEIKEQKDEVEAQRDEIEAQRDDLKTQRDLVMVQKKEITDSINYALRIQNAVLPGDRYLSEIMPEYFVLFHPRDIVSGDFYWIKCIKNFLIMVVADCTGHGVPGAFMSILGISLLNEQVGRRRLDKPGEILDRLRRKIKDTLAQEGRFQEQKDGMDMALIMYDIDSKELQYAGAFNPLYLIRHKQNIGNGDLREFTSLSNTKYQLFELKGDRQPIAIHARENKFTTRNIRLMKGDSLYLFTDGYVDQIGGPKSKKFLPKNFKKALLSIQEVGMAEQKESLEKTLSEWKGTHDQVDDILVMGMRI